MPYLVRAPRYLPLATVASVKDLATGLAADGTLVNISPNGCCIHVASIFPGVDRDSLVEVKLAGHSVSKTLTGRVCRVRNGNESYAHIHFNETAHDLIALGIASMVACPGSQSHINPDDQVEHLLAHAQLMWDAEEHNSSRFERRSRMIQAIAAGTLAFLAFGIFRAAPALLLSDAGTAAGSSETAPLDSGSLSAAPAMAGVDGDVATGRPGRIVEGILSDDALHWGAIALVVVPVTASIILIFAALANEILHREDEFRYPPQSAFKEVPTPQRTWRELDTATVVGEAVCLALSTLGAIRGPKRHRAKLIAMSPGRQLSDAYENLGWATPRPIVRRVDTASFYLQFTRQGAAEAYGFLQSCSPPSALVFRSTYLAANSLRRWNQRKIDELRRSESLLIHGLLFAALSAIAFINAILSLLPNYPFWIMLGAGTGLLVLSAAGRCVLLYSRTRKFQSGSSGRRFVDAQQGIDSDLDTGMTKG